MVVTSPANSTVPSAFVVTLERALVPPTAPPKLVLPEPEELAVRERAVPSELSVRAKVIACPLTMASAPRMVSPLKITLPPAALYVAVPPELEIVVVPVLLVALLV